MPKFVDHRKQLEAGEEFFLQEERGYQKMYKLIKVDLMPGIFMLSDNGTVLPGNYMIIETNHIRRILTGSGVAMIMDPIPFYKILFVN